MFRRRLRPLPLGRVFLPAAAAPTAPPTRSPWRLWLYGAGMLVPLCSFAWRYPLPGNGDRLNDLGNMAQYQPGAFLWFAGGMALLFGLYLLAMRESRRLPARRALPAVFGCGAAFAAAMAWMYPVTAIDIFLYAARSRLFTTYGANPIAAYPGDFPTDAWRPFVPDEWSVEVSPYGPLWNLVAAPVTLLAGDRMVVALSGFKVLAVLSLLAGGGVIARILAGSASPTGATGALLYLWNPLVLWEGVGNGHNDLVMMVPLLLALLAWARGRDHLVIPLLVVAALLKYVTVLLVPLAAIAVWRRADGWAARRRLVAWTIGLSALAAAIALAPFYDLTAIRNSVASQGSMLLTSPAAVAVGLLQRHHPGTDGEWWVKRAGEGILLVTLAWQARDLWKRPERLPRASFEVLYVFLLVATWNFRGWYLIWLVGLAAVLPWGWPGWRAVAWAVGAIAASGLFVWGWRWWRTDFATIQNVAVPMIFGATALLTLGEHLCRAVAAYRSQVEDDDQPAVLPASG